ncbi:MAG TPA: hypothetical protein EYP68_06355 [Candidatus Korarchaeota archaeon]|nr:hypothetical protein [Candidatus Korarchaeota archaeon]
MSRSTITISENLRRRLSVLKGNKTWDEFLSELLNAAISSRIDELEDFLRETAEKRDLPFKRMELRLREGHEGSDG